MTAMMYAASAEANSSAAFSLIAQIVGSDGVSQPDKNRMLRLAAFGGSHLGGGDWASKCWAVAGSASTVQWLIDAGADPNTEVRLAVDLAAVRCCRVAGVLGRLRLHRGPEPTDAGCRRFIPTLLLSN